MRGMSSREILLYLGGLRGLAILLVVLFHMLPQYFSQGFLGVDIFLVISGYLLFRAYDGESAFKFWEFVRKKVVRIYPVMCCAIILACVLMAFAMYSADEAKVLTRTVRYALLGKVNGYFNKQYTDYFSDSANLNPLLHLWYLAVIVQVYMLWAVGCWVVSFLRHRFTAHQVLIRKWATFLIVLVALASFVYSHSLAIHDALASLGVPVWQQAQEVAYWDTFGRLWQVAAGGLVLVLPPCRKPVLCTMLAALGLGLLLLLGFCNAASVPCAALLTVLSVVLVLRYLPDTRLKALLEQRWLVWVGSISFSLYLVHFPLLVFYKRWEKLFPDATVATALVIISLALAYALWFFVEKRRTGLIVAALLVGCAFGSAYGIRKYIKKVIEPELRATSGAAGVAYPSYNRKLEQVPEVLFEKFNQEEMCANIGTFSMLYDVTKPPYPVLMPLGASSDRPEFVLLGDSNAQHWYSGLNEFCHKQGISGLHSSTIVVPLMDRYVQRHHSYRWDEAKAKALFNWLEHHSSIHTVLLSNLWTRLFPRQAKDWQGKNINPTFEENAASLREFCSQLRVQGKQVVLVMPSPILPHLNKQLCGRMGEYVSWMHFRNKQFDAENDNHPLVLTKSYYEEHYREVLSLFNLWEQEGFCSILHVERAMFNGDRLVGVRNGVMMFRDTTHITPPFSIEIMEQMSADLSDIIQRGRKSRRETAEAEVQGL